MHKGCIKDQDTPCHDPECIGLKKETQLDDKTMLRDNINELVITDKAASSYNKVLQEHTERLGYGVEHK